MRAHKDLEFAVDDVAGKQRTFRSFAEAAAFAVSVACSGRESGIDVICWSRSAARAWAGDDGAERYDEDPEASVFERILIRAESEGMIA